MALRVARIPYLSCEPFYFEMARRGIELCDMVPSALAGAAARGEIDTGPMPLVDCFHLDEQFRLLSGFRAIEPGVPGHETHLVRSLVRGVGGFGKMPLQGPFLSSAEIDEIVAWIDAGMPEGPADETQTHS